jgi:hypothetical protein
MGDAYEPPQHRFVDRRAGQRKGGVRQDRRHIRPEIGAQVQAAVGGRIRLRSTPRRSTPLGNVIMWAGRARPIWRQRYSGILRFACR